MFKTPYHGILVHYTLKLLHPEPVDHPCTINLFSLPPRH